MKATNQNCEQLKNDIKDLIDHMSCEELGNLNYLQVEAYEKIDQKKFQQIQGKFYKYFENEPEFKGRLFFQIDNNSYNMQVLKQRVRFLYLYFGVDPDIEKLTLYLRFTNRDDLQNDFLIKSDEKLFKVNQNHLLELITDKNALNISVTAYLKKYNDMVLQRTKKEATIYVKNYMQDVISVGTIDHIITIHAVCEDDGRLSLAMQVNSTEKGGSEYYNKGTLWP